MAMEIERKYLVINDSYKKSAAVNRYKQGYISVDVNRIVRMRIVGEKAILTLKSLVSELSRLEYEYEIPLADANEIMDKICRKPIIEKNRYQLTIAGNEWIVDEFLGENKGLVVAEIELKSEDQEFTTPDWIGSEVTGDPRYINANLVKNPFKFWKK